MPANEVLETSEITVVEREYDAQGRVTKETVTVTKPRALPFNPNQTGGTPLAPWKHPWRWPEVTYWGDPPNQWTTQTYNTC